MIIILVFEKIRELIMTDINNIFKVYINSIFLDMKRLYKLGMK